MSDPIYEAQAYEIAKMARSIRTLESENAKLRKFAAVVWELLTKNEPMFVWQGMADEAHELGAEVSAC